MDDVPSARSFKISFPRQIKMSPLQALLAFKKGKVGENSGPGSLTTLLSYPLVPSPPLQLEVEDDERLAALK